MSERLDSLRDQHRRRLDRQLQLISKAVPFMARPMRFVLKPSMWVVRVPLALIFMAGGLLGFLPVLGFWMLPLGAMLLAVDFTPIRPAVAGGVVRGRRKVSLWRRAWQAWRRGTGKPVEDNQADNSAVDLRHSSAEVPSNQTRQSGETGECATDRASAPDTTHKQK